MKAIAGIAACLLLLGACERGERQPSPPPRIAAREVRRAVLTAGDMGAGWTRVRNPTLNTVQIGGRVGAANVQPSVAQRTSAFTQDQGDAFVSNTVFLLRSERMARAVIAAHEQAAEDGSWSQEREDGGKATFRFFGTVEQLPALGDDMFAASLRVTVTTAAGRQSQHVVEYVAYRIDTLVAFVVAQDVAVSPYARRQEAKVAKLVT